MSEPRVIVEQVEEPWPGLEIKNLDGMQDLGIEPWQKISKDGHAGQQEQDTKPNKTKKYQCDICQSWLSRKSHLDRHMLLKHTQEKNFKCDFCDKAFKQKSDLTIHERVHIGQDYKSCDVCDKFFTTQTRLNMHMKIHTGIGLFNCDKCEQSFPERRQLKSHVIKEHMTYTPCKERPLQCDVCQKTFKTSFSLTWHKQFHSDDLKHKCKLCGERFVSSHYLGIHRSRVHRGKEPYVCSICDKSFDFSRNLKRHRKKIHKVIDDPDIDMSSKRIPLEQKVERISLELKGELNDEASKNDYGLYKCKICNQRFDNSRKIRKHMVSHTGVMPFQCNMCKNSYCFPYELRKHKKKIHNMEDSPAKDKSKIKRKLKDNDISENDLDSDKNDSFLDDHENSNDSLEAYDTRSKKRKFVLEETEEMPFKCNLCNKRYLSSNELREHKKDYHRVEDDALEDDFSNIDVVIQLPSDHEELEDFEEKYLEEKVDENGSFAGKSNSFDEKLNINDKKSNNIKEKLDINDEKLNTFDEKLKTFDEKSKTNHKKSDLSENKLNLDDEKSNHDGKVSDTDENQANFNDEKADFNIKKSPGQAKKLSKVSEHDYRKCGVCDEICKSSRALKKHMMLHTGVAPFNCDVCNYNCVFNGDFQRHKQSKIHLKRVQLMQEQDDKNKAETLSNDQANEDTIQSDNESVDNTYDATRDNDDFEEVIDQDLNNEEMNDQSQKLAKTCDICGEKFQCNEDLAIHKVLHIGKFPFNCDICDHHCVFKADFEKHKKSKKHRKRIIRLKGKEDQNNLMIDSISDDDTLTIDNYNTNEDDKLLDDSFIEPSTGIKRVKRTVQEKTLNYNENNDENDSSEDPIDVSSFLEVSRKGIRKCNICNELFENSRKLRKHSILHTGKMPFSCDICTKSYLFPYELRKHKKSVHEKDEKSTEVISTNMNDVTVTPPENEDLEHIDKPNTNESYNENNLDFDKNKSQKKRKFKERYVLSKQKKKPLVTEDDEQNQEINVNDDLIEMRNENNDFVDESTKNIDDSLIDGNKEDKRSSKKSIKNNLKDKRVISTKVFTVSNKYNPAEESGFHLIREKSKIGKRVLKKNSKDLIKKDNKKVDCAVCGKNFSFKVDLEIHQTIVKACNSNPINLDIEFSVSDEVEDVNVSNCLNITNEDSNTDVEDIHDYGDFNNDKRSAQRDVDCNAEDVEERMENNFDYEIEEDIISNNSNIDLEQNHFIPAHEIVKVENEIFDTEVNSTNEDVNSEHNTIKEVIEDFPFQCDVCEIVFNDSDLLKTHFKSMKHKRQVYFYKKSMKNT